MPRPPRIGSGFDFNDPTALFGPEPQTQASTALPSEMTDAWREYAWAVTGAVPHNIGRTYQAAAAIRRSLR